MKTLITEIAGKTRILVLVALTTLTAMCWAGKPVNVNQANAETIAESLDGIGLKKAEDLVKFRDANGPFKTPEELVKVKGIGEKTLAKNAEFIRL